MDVRRERYKTELGRVESGESQTVAKSSTITKEIRLATRAERTYCKVNGEKIKSKCQSGKTGDGTFGKSIKQKRTNLT